MSSHIHGSNRLQHWFIRRQSSISLWWGYRSYYPLHSPTKQGKYFIYFQCTSQFVKTAHPLIILFFIYLGQNLVLEGIASSQRLIFTPSSHIPQHRAVSSGPQPLPTIYINPKAIDTQHSSQERNAGSVSLSGSHLIVATYLSLEGTFENNI